MDVQFPLGAMLIILCSTVHSVLQEGPIEAVQSLVALTTARNRTVAGAYLLGIAVNQFVSIINTTEAERQQFFQVGSYRLYLIYLINVSHSCVPSIPCYSLLAMYSSSIISACSLNLAVNDL